MTELPDSMRRMLGVSSLDLEGAMQELLRKFAGFQTLDPTGAAGDVSKWVPRYKLAVAERHAAFMSQWTAKAHDQALVELHFFLIAASRIVAFMTMAADRMGGEVKLHVNSRDFSGLKQARDHFEHIEDRLYGSKRNRVRPITEGGTTRTVHLGLRATDYHLIFGDKAVDVSPAFVADFLSFVDHFLSLIDAAVEAATPITK